MNCVIYKSVLDVISSSNKTPDFTFISHLF